MDASTEIRPLAERLDDPVTADVTREALAELADLIGSYESWNEHARAENEARVRGLFAVLFGHG